MRGYRGAPPTGSVRAAGADQKPLSASCRAQPSAGEVRVVTEKEGRHPRGRLSCFRLSAGTQDPLTDVAWPDRIAPRAGDPLGAT